MNKIKTILTLSFFSTIIFLSACLQTKKTDENQSSKEKIYVVDTLTLKSAVFNNTRNIRVYLPPDYYEPKANRKKYPVLFLNDGIAVFHAYNLKKTVDSLILSKAIIPLVVVGIDNGASTLESTNPSTDRANEYLPWPDSTDLDTEYFVEDPQGKQYLNFLFDEVIPLVNKYFKVDESNMGLGGPSRGGLIALYTVIHNPGKFDKLLLESPPLYINNRKILKEADKLNNWPTLIYIGIGTDEGDNESIHKMVVNDVDHLKGIIEQNAHSEIKYILDEGAKHDYDAFASRFPKAIEFLYSSKR